MREEKPGKEIITASLKKKKEFQFIHKNATAGRRPGRPVITMLSWLAPWAAAACVTQKQTVRRQYIILDTINA